MAVDIVKKTGEDAVKRGKLLTLSLLIALSIFIQTLLQLNTDKPVQIFLISGGYFLLAFLGLIWAFNFRVKFKSIQFLIQSALFVLSEYLFIQLFFIQKFSRIYEGLLLLVLIALVFLGTYVSFLMANVFNVNLYKSIPLVHVGRTASYIISAFTLFFLIFGLLAGELPVYILIPLVCVVSVYLSYIHLRNLGFESVLLFRKTLLVSLFVIFMFVSTFISGVLHEVSALAPVVGYFVGIGMANYKGGTNAKKWELVVYIIILILVILLNIRLNIFA